MHVYLLQQVHETGVNLGQEAQEEDEREAQGEHCQGGNGKAQSVSPQTTPWPTTLRATLPQATSMLSNLTGSHIPGTEEEGGGEEREAVQRDGWEGLS